MTAPHTPLIEALRPWALLWLVPLLAACSSVQQPARALPAELAAAETLYRQHCQSCHGPSAVGTDLGPPLLDPLYHPGSTSDDAFLAAVRFGVKAKRWQMGDMPATAGVSPTDTEAIIAYVRYLQRTAPPAGATPAAATTSPGAP